MKYQQASIEHITIDPSEHILGLFQIETLYDCSFFDQIDTL